jgi:hypothetical protein
MIPRRLIAQRAFAPRTRQFTEPARTARTVTDGYRRDVARDEDVSAPQPHCFDETLMPAPANGFATPTQS